MAVPPYLLRRVLSDKYGNLFRSSDGVPWTPGRFESLEIGSASATAAPTSDAAGELCARMTARPTRARRALISSLISSLTTSGVWDKLDGFYVLAAHSAQAAKLNWVGCAQDLTAVNSPIFQIDRGFTGDGLTGYLDTGVAANALERYLAEDATLGVYNRTSLAASAYIDISAGSAAYLNPSASSTMIFRANTTSGSALNAANGGNITGLFAWSRSGTSAKAYRAGAQIGTTQTGLAAGTRAGNNVLALRDGSGTNYSVHQLAAIVFGSSLTDTEHAALNTALVTYLTAIGGN